MVAGSGRRKPIGFTSGVRIEPGRVAVVTSLGIGRGIAIAFPGRGGNVVLLDRDADFFERAAGELSHHHPWATVIPIVADVSDSDAVGAAAGQVFERFGEANAAGVPIGCRWSVLAWCAAISRSRRRSDIGSVSCWFKW